MVLGDVKTSYLNVMEIEAVWFDILPQSVNILSLISKLYERGSVKTTGLIPYHSDAF